MLTKDYLAQLVVLLAEDDSVQRVLTQEVLKRIGIKDFLVAENGEEAMDILLREHVNLVIIDKDMPVMDGLDLVAFIRRTPVLRHLMIVMLSGDLTESTSPSVEEQQLRDFLGRKNVAPLPKTSLNGDSLRHAILNALG